jgi:hypothetical protein
MEKINCISGHYDAGVKLELNTVIDCVNLRVDEGVKINMVMLGKAEVQELINQLEELKNDIL